MRFIDMGVGEGFVFTDKARSLLQRYHKGVGGHHKGEDSGVAYFIDPYRTNGGDIGDKQEANTIVSRYYKGIGNIAEPHVKYRIEGDEMWEHSLISAGRRGGSMESKNICPTLPAALSKQSFNQATPYVKYESEKLPGGDIPWQDAMKTRSTSHSPTQTQEGEESEPG